MKKKSIVFVNQYYLPEKNPPAKRMSAFAEYFAKKGWDVKVITANPNYPLGQFFKGYGFRYTKELINGVTVHRLPVIPSKNEGLVMRVLNYFSYALSIKVYKNLLRADVAFISSPPLFGAMTAHKIARKRGIPIVLDVRDLWPESFVTLGMMKGTNPLYVSLKKKVKNMYVHSKHIISATEGIRKAIKKQTKQPVSTITNFAQTKKRKISTNESKKISVVFTGIITPAQDLRGFLQCNKDARIQEKFDWHLIGDGDQLEGIRDDIRKNMWKNVKVYGYKSYDFCEKMIAGADLCLVTLAQKELFRGALPSKFFEYLSYGKPVINFWSKEMGEHIIKNDAGYSILNKKAINDTLLRINKKDLKIKQVNATKLFKEHFEREKVCEKLDKIVRGIV